MPFHRFNWVEDDIMLPDIPDWAETSEFTKITILECFLPARNYSKCHVNIESFDPPETNSRCYYPPSLAEEREGQVTNTSVRCKNRKPLYVRFRQEVQDEKSERELEFICEALPLLDIWLFL